MEAGLCLPSTLGAGARPLRSGSSYQHHFPLRCRRRAGIWPVSKAIRNFSNLAPRLCNKARPAAAPSLADQALLLIPSAIVARPSHHAPIFGIVPFSLSVSSEGMRALFVEAVWSGETVCCKGVLDTTVFLSISVWLGYSTLNLIAIGMRPG